MGLLIKSPSQVASGLPFSYLSSEQRGARIGRAAGAQTQRPQRRPDLRAEGRLVRLAPSRDGGRGPVHLGRCRGDLAAAAADLGRGPRCRPARPRRRRRRPRWRCRRRPTPLGRGPELILPWSPPSSVALRRRLGRSCRTRAHLRVSSRPALPARPGRLCRLAHALAAVSSSLPATLWARDPGWRGSLPLPPHKRLASSPATAGLQPSPRQTLTSSRPPHLRPSHGCSRAPRRPPTPTPRPQGHRRPPCHARPTVPPPPSAAAGSTALEGSDARRPPARSRNGGGTQRSGLAGRGAGARRRRGEGSRSAGPRSGGVPGS